jgi:hypothetical protein
MRCVGLAITCPAVVCGSADHKRTTLSANAFVRPRSTNFFSCSSFILRPSSFVLPPSSLRYGHRRPHASKKRVRDLEINQFLVLFIFHPSAFILSQEGRKSLVIISCPDSAPRTAPGEVGRRVVRVLEKTIGRCTHGVPR